MNDKTSRSLSLGMWWTPARTVRKVPPIQLIISTLVLIFTPGCMNAQNTRFPSWYTWYPGAENEAYERQDPFSDPDIGPATDFAPRGYDRPRSEARRAAEQRMFQGQPVGPEYARPGVPQGGLKSDRAVY